jgi:pimeloyl-ACP methyl ester carboxylesterase
VSIDARRPRLNLVESGTGPDFVFQHGLCGNAAQPAEVFPAEVPFRRVTLECRGHGQSEAGDPTTFSIATFADDVAAMIKARKTAPVILGGISMGAAFALRLAVKQPGLVRALVLARPAWLTDTAPPNMQAYAEVGELLSRFPSDEARMRFDRTETAHWLETEGPDNLVSLRSFFTREPIATTSALLTRIAADGPRVSTSEVEALRLPTLVIGQARDPLHPLAYAERIAAMIPGARFETITPKAESRERYVADFRAVLARFLRELSHGER